MVERMYEGEAEGVTDGNVAESIRFAQACGVRVYWVDDLQEGALYLASFGIVLMDTGLSRERCQRVLRTALARVRI